MVKPTLCKPRQVLLVGIAVITLLALNVPARQSPTPMLNTFHPLTAAASFQDPEPQATIFFDDFETEQGWVRDPNGTDTATTGLWERGDPEPTSSSGASMQLGNTVSGINALVTGRLAGSSAGANDVDGGITSIRSPAITLPSSGTLTLSFSSYLAHLSNASSADFLRVRIVSPSTNTIVLTVSGSAAVVSGAWVARTVSLNSFAGQTIQIQFEAADNSTASLIEAGVDNVVVNQDAVILGANLAQNHPATGSTPCNSNEGPAKAVNGSVSLGNSDKWCSLAATKFLQVDLGATFTVNAFVVKHAGAGGESASFNTRDFNIQVSTNGTNFTQVVNVTANTASITTHSINPITARFVRLNVITPTQTTNAAARIYELEVYHPFPPLPPASTLTDWIPGHGTSMTRHAFDDHIALYVDGNVNRSNIGWVLPFATQAFQYMKRTYSHFGPDRLYIFLHQGQFGGGTISSYFDAFSNFRNASDTGSSTWVRGDNIDLISHEMCHIVEGSNNGVHESPAFEVWRDSKWAEFFQYDLYVALGMQADADRVFNKFMATRDNFPQPNTAWFRDWFFPLWQRFGGGPVMARFFKLISLYFPRHLENGGRNFTYDRRMNLGEFIHFSIGAAGTDLRSMATTAFGTGWETQFDQARRDFPAITY